MDSQKDNPFAVEEGRLSGDDYGGCLEGHHPDTLPESKGTGDI